MKIRTRFAPSPTGYLHLGGARTALFNWLYARKHRGEYLLRIEDTDRKRSTDEFTQDVLTSLSWLGLESHLAPIYQSTRMAKYQEAIQQLLDAGKAYHCYCSKERLDTLRQQQMLNRQKPRYDGFCRNLTHTPATGTNPVVRFKNPLDGDVKIEDRVRGTVNIRNDELDDLILARSDGTPTYQLCAVVDDIDFATTHVIRGDDHLNNTPRQINIFRALRRTAPAYVHVPLIHGKDGGRLAKRHGAESVNQYRRDGFLPQALLNYLARLGWSHGDQEIFSVEEMVELFNLDAIHRSAATFDLEKLLWVNHQHMQKTAGATIKPILKAYFNAKGIYPDSQPDTASLFDALKGRCKTIQELCDASAFFYQEIDRYDDKASGANFGADSIEILQTLKHRLKAIDDWSAASVKIVIKSAANDMSLNMSKVAPPLRLAVTGRTVSPSIDVTLALLGAKKSLRRIERAIEYIAGSV